MEEHEERIQDIGKESVPLTLKEAEQAIREVILSEIVEEVSLSEWISLTISEDPDTEDLEAAVVDAAADKVERVVADTMRAVSQFDRRSLMRVMAVQWEGWREAIEVAVEEAVGNDIDGDEWQTAIKTIVEAAVPNICKAAVQSRKDAEAQVKAMLDTIHAAAIHFRIKEIETQYSKPAVEAAIAELESIAMNFVEESVTEDAEGNELTDEETEWLQEEAEEAAKEAITRIQTAVERAATSFVVRAKATLERQASKADLSWVTDAMDSVVDTAEQAAQHLDSTQIGEVETDWPAQVLRSLQIDLAMGTVSGQRQQIRGTEEGVAVDETGLQDVQAYCLGCQSQTDMEEPRWVMLKNGTHAIQGYCYSCGQRVTKFAKPPPSAIASKQKISHSGEELSEQITSSVLDASEKDRSVKVFDALQPVTEGVVGSLYDFIEGLAQRRVQLEITPMFSPRGKPVNLAGYAAIAMGWKRSRKGAQNRATGSRGPAEVLSEVFRLSSQELEALQKAERGETYARGTTSVVGRLKAFCQRNEWTRENRAGRYARLLRAAQSGHSVRISYQDASDAVTERVIDVYGIGNGYIDAYDHLRSALRTFRVSRIRQIQVTDIVYSIPESYEPTDWVKKGEGELHREVDGHAVEGEQTSTQSRTTPLDTMRPASLSTGTTEPARGSGNSSAQSQGLSRQPDTYRVSYPSGQTPRDKLSSAVSWLVGLLLLGGWIAAIVFAFRYVEWLGSVLLLATIWILLAGRRNRRRR